MGIRLEYHINRQYYFLLFVLLFPISIICCSKDNSGCKEICTGQSVEIPVIFINWENIPGSNIIVQNDSIKLCNDYFARTYYSVLITKKQKEFLHNLLKKSYENSDTLKIEFTDKYNMMYQSIVDYICSILPLKFIDEFVEDKTIYATEYNDIYKYKAVTNNKTDSIEIKVFDSLYNYNFTLTINGLDAFLWDERNYIYDSFKLTDQQKSGLDYYLSRININSYFQDYLWFHPYSQVIFKVKDKVIFDISPVRFTIPSYEKLYHHLIELHTSLISNYQN